MLSESNELSLRQRVYPIEEENGSVKPGKGNSMEISASATGKLNEILREALLRGASDIHMEPYGKELLIRYRCDGRLDQYGVVEAELAPMVLNRMKVMAEMNSVEKRLPQDGHLAVEYGRHVYDIRVSSLPLFQGEKLVLRILGQQDQMLPLEELGFSEENMNRVKKLLAVPGGMILVCGPTGSGKTTTLYSMLARLKETGKNIITLEDPVEYEMAGINQVQINERTGLTFAKGLRSVLRQDPDMIMVGEIRDLESAEIAVRLAYTGHLVLASLHTGDALSAVNRMVEMGIAPHMLASCLNGVIAQRLVRKEVQGVPQGRMAIQEVMVCDDDLKSEITRYDTFSLKKQELEQGFATLWQDGLKKWKDGLVTKSALEEVLGPMPERYGNEGKQ